MNEKKPNPEISVTIPIYNAESSLSHTLDSVLQQSFSNFELILINDGSTDNSLSICKEYSEKDNRIKIIDQPNMGICTARNSGIKASKGKYFLFVDSDDLIHPQMFEILINQIKSNDADISMCQTNPIFLNEIKEWESYELPVKKDILNNTEVIRRLFSSCDIDFQYMGMWNKLYNRRIIENEEFRNVHPEDVDMNYRLYKKSCNINSCNLKLYNYIQHSNSFCHQKFNERDVNFLSTYYDIFTDLKSENRNKEAYWCLTKLYKIIINKKYNSRNTEFHEDVIKQSRIILKKTFLFFLSNIHRSFTQNTAILIFILFPVLHNLFMKYKESR